MNMRGSAQRWVRPFQFRKKLLDSLWKNSIMAGINHGRKETKMENAATDENNYMVYVFEGSRFLGWVNRITVHLRNCDVRVLGYEGYAQNISANLDIREGIKTSKEKAEHLCKLNENVGCASYIFRAVQEGEEIEDGKSYWIYVNDSISRVGWLKDIAVTKCGNGDFQEDVVCTLYPESAANYTENVKYITHFAKWLKEMGKSFQIMEFIYPPNRK